MRLRAARRDAPTLGRAAALLLLAVVALPAASNARRAEPVEFRYWPAGQGRIEARTESGARLGSCSWDDERVLVGGNACFVTVEAGTRVQFVATGAGADSPFLAWDRSECPGTGPCTVPASAEDLVGATFRKQRLEVRRVPQEDGGEGRVTWAGRINCPGTCTAWVDAGTEVVLEAQGPHTWGRGCEPAGGSPTSATCSVTMSNLRVFVNVGFGTDPDLNFPFDQRVKLTVRRSGGGSGRVTGNARDPDGEEHRIDCGGTCTADNLDLQTIATLRAEQATGSRFVGWVGVCGAEVVCRFSVGSKKHVAAVFEPVTSNPPPPPQPPPPPGFQPQVTKITVVGRRAVVLRVVVDRRATATLRLVRGSSTLVTRRYTLQAGRKDLRFALPRGLAPGWYRMRGRFVGAAGESASLDRPFRLRP